MHLEAVKDLDQAKEVYLKGKNGYTLEDIKITEYITEYQTLKEVWKTALDKALGEKLYEVTIEAYNLKTKEYETGKAKVYDDGNKVRFAYMVKEFPTIVLPEGVYDTQLRGIYEEYQEQLSSNATNKILTDSLTEIVFIKDSERAGVLGEGKKRIEWTLYGDYVLRIAKFLIDVKGKPTAKEHLFLTENAKGTLNLKLTFEQNKEGYKLLLYRGTHIASNKFDVPEFVNTGEIWIEDGEEVEMKYKNINLNKVGLQYYISELVTCYKRLAESLNSVG